MLSVLESAQAAGQKAQEDLQIGQGSIFDLGGDDGAGAGVEPRVARPSHPPIPSDEFDRPELLALEKESLGLFISAHPLKAVREAMAEQVDCPLSEVVNRRDNEWVRVGGIVTQTKRIRTKKGDHMMFATLDDLGGQVELLVFGNALADNEAALAPDRIVLTRGRVDHKDAATTCLIVQEAELFEPTPEQIEAARERAARPVLPPEPVRLRVDAGRLPASVLGELKLLLENFPGECEVVLEMQTSSGARRLRLGPEWRVTPSKSLRSELHQLLGEAALAA
jgi:DNA polymerase-3 subunit alpha